MRWCVYRNYGCPVATGRTPILWLHGSDAVGKTSVAWEIFTLLTEAGVAAAYVDTDNLGFCVPTFADEARLVELNLASMWPNFLAAGARCLVVAGFLASIDHRRRFEAAIPAGELTLCRLRARPETLATRMLRRGQTDGLGTDGAVTGLSIEGLTYLGERAATFGAKLDAEDIADFAVDTDDLSVPTLARVVLERANGWPAASKRYPDEGID
jgi:hypothetical protein